MHTTGLEARLSLQTPITRNSSNDLLANLGPQHASVHVQIWPGVQCETDANIHENEHSENLASTEAYDDSTCLVQYNHVAC